MIKSILTGLFCFFFFLTLHVVIFRTVKLQERFRCLSLIFFSLIPVYVVIYFALPHDYLMVVPTVPTDSLISLERFYLLSSVLNFLTGLMFYVFLFLGYCQFYFIVDRSISVRVMIEIEKSSDKALSFDQIKGIYDFDRVLSRRMEHMVYGKYVEEQPRGYANTTKGRIEARLFNFLKEFLRLGPGG